MKTLTIIITLAAFPLLAKAANGLSIALVHPNSKSLLATYGNKLPEAIAKDFRILYVRNTGIGNHGDKPDVNGLIISKSLALTQKHFIGYEGVSNSSGCDAGIIHLKYDARDVASEFVRAHTGGRFALLVDDEWVYYTADMGELRPGEGLIVIPVLDQRDKERFQNLALGKRGMHADDPLPTDDSASAAPAPTIKGK